METTSRPPYFTQPELLNELVKAFGLKSNLSGLRSDYLYRDHDHQLRQLVILHIQKYLDFTSPLVLSIRKTIIDFIEHCLDTYLTFVTTISLDTMNRDQAREVFTKKIFPFFLTNLVLLIEKVIPSYSPMNFFGEKSAINNTFDWFEIHIIGWDSFWRNLDDKEAKDMFLRWRKNVDLPSVNKIKDLDSYDPKLSINAGNWELIKSLLILSRVFDYFRNHSKQPSKWLDNMRKALWSGSTSLDVGKILSLENFGYTDLMVDGAPLPHQPDTIIRWLIDRLRS